MLRIEAILATVEDHEQRGHLKFIFDERVAICEIDGGLSMDDAERIATDEVLREKRRMPVEVF